MRAIRRHDDQIAALGGDHVVAGEHLGGAVQQIEHLGGAVVHMRAGTVGARREGDAHGGQRTAGGVAVRQQPYGDGVPADHLGPGLPHQRGLLEPRHEQRHLRLPTVRCGQAAKSSAALTRTTAAVAR